MKEYRIKLYFRSGKTTSIYGNHPKTLKAARKEIERMQTLYAGNTTSQAPVKYEIISRDVSPWKVVE